MASRYAIYFVPDGIWGDFGASWLGWDNRTGREIALASSDLAALTDRPRKYGFHGTVKPPFRLADGQSVDALKRAVQGLCKGFEPFTLRSLQLTQIGRFFAMTAPDDHAALRSVADSVVQELDTFRAPLNEQELARRRASRLTARQEGLLQRWGYPYVLEEFKFHLTLTGPCKNPDATRLVLEDALARVQNEPLSIDALCLLKEDDVGRHKVIARFPFGAV